MVRRALLYLLALLALVVITALWLDRAVVNFARNDALAYQLFAHFRAPEILVRPDTELVLKAPALTAETVFERAADIRDAHLDGSMPTLEAVNSVLTQAHTHGAWRRELRRLAHRVRTTDYRAYGAGAYDWLLRNLLGPFFRWRLAFLDDRERRRVARAEKAGEFHKIAWLATQLPQRARPARHALVSRQLPRTDLSPCQVLSNANIGKRPIPSLRSPDNFAVDWRARPVLSPRISRPQRSEHVSCPRSSSSSDSRRYRVSSDS